MNRRPAYALMFALLAPARALAESPAHDAGPGCTYHRDCPCGTYCNSGFCNATPPPESFTTCTSDNDCNATCTNTTCVGGVCRARDGGMGAPPADVPDASFSSDITVSDVGAFDGPADDRLPDAARPPDARADAAPEASVDGATDAPLQVSSDASTDGATAPPPASEGGASCATTPTRMSSSSASALALAAVALAVLRRRRR